MCEPFPNIRIWSRLQLQRTLPIMCHHGVYDLHVKHRQMRSQDFLQLVLHSRASHRALCAYDVYPNQPTRSARAFPIDKRKPNKYEEKFPARIHCTIARKHACSNWRLASKARNTKKDERNDNAKAVWYLTIHRSVDALLVAKTPSNHFNSQPSCLS